MNKIDLIIDALEKAKDGWQCFDEYEKALAAARELRELKPVAWAATSEDGAVEAIGYSKSRRFDTPLYALEDTK
jgi:hypothetical protein